jgi:hypothetical protein
MGCLIKQYLPFNPPRFRVGFGSVQWFVPVLQALAMLVSLPMYPYILIGKLWSTNEGSAVTGTSSSSLISHGQFSKQSGGCCEWYSSPPSRVQAGGFGNIA